MKAVWIRLLLTPSAGKSIIFSDGVLKADTLRNILTRKVLKPLATRFPGKAGKKCIEGQDSKMVRHYYHLHDKPSQEHIARVQFLGKAVS